MRGSITGTIWRLLGEPTGRHLSVDDWEQRRVSSHETPTTGVCSAEALVMEVSWIAMACFVETVNPEALALSPERLAHVKGDLDRLAGLPALEVYAACLGRLAIPEHDV